MDIIKGMLRNLDNTKLNGVKIIPINLLDICDRLTREEKRLKDTRQKTNGGQL